MRFLVLSLFFALPLFAGQEITFHRDVEPVLQKHCQQCHRPGEAVPMALLTYEQVRPWARAIQEAVALNRMPPWFADPEFGKWTNAHEMAQQDRDTILNWVESDAKRGNPEDAPEPLTFVEGWNIDEPDVVLELPHAFEVPAEGTIDYHYVVIPTGFEEDKWVTAAEIRPGNREVVHHVIAFMRPADSHWLEEAKPGEIFVPTRYEPKKGKEKGNEYRELLVGFAPGLQAASWGKEYAKLLPVGSDIILQLHYTTNGEEVLDRTTIGLKFRETMPQKRVVTMMASNDKFLIPAGESAHPVKSQWILNQDTELVSVMPHMHLRGKDFRYELQYPNGNQETLLNIPNYDFDWQFFYYLRQPKMLPAGTVIDCLAHFDNSPNNPDNPDPAIDVSWGDQSWEEMMIGFFDIAIDNGADIMPYLKQGKRRNRTSD